MLKMGDPIHTAKAGQKLNLEVDMLAKHVARLVESAWFLVLGSWFLVLGSWFLVLVFQVEPVGWPTPRIHPMA